MLRRIEPIVGFFPYLYVVYPFWPLRCDSQGSLEKKQNVDTRLNSGADARE